jgi:chromosomal replication initiation ATPase DnaA
VVRPPPARPQQLRLSLRRPAPQTREAFAAGPSNAQALAAIDAWPAWPGGCLLLVGPQGVGKSHLAAAWAERAGAATLDRDAPDVAAAGDAAVVLEDVDRGVADEALFHLINLAGRGGGLLMTARKAPALWPAALPDLRSRLNALYVAEIHEPDDAVLHRVLRKFFSERSMAPPEEVYAYLLRRMPRSIAAAWDVVRRMDEAGEGAISRLLARQILEGDDQNLDLFE